MNENEDTPRTNAQIYIDGIEPMVHADFARELERENINLRRALTASMSLARSSRKQPSTRRAGTATAANASELNVKGQPRPKNHVNITP